MSDEVFGAIVRPKEVERAVKATLERWAPTYLRAMERRDGLPPGSYPNVASWRAADTMEERFPEQMIPAVQIMLTDNVDLDTQAESATGLFEGTIDVLVQSIEPEPARELAGTYGFILGLILTQQSGLDGSLRVSGIGWEKMGVPAVGKAESRWLALGSAEVHIAVDRIYNPLAGPTKPTELAPEPPSGKEPESWPVAQEKKLTVEEKAS